MNKCTNCGSHAINQHMHGRGGDNLDLCDVCYWRARFDALRDAVAWEREVEWLNDLITEQYACVSEMPPEEEEISVSYFEARVKVDRLIANAADCKGKGRKNKIKSSMRDVLNRRTCAHVQ